MSDSDTTATGVIAALRERAKELSCLYAVEELLGQADAALEDVLRGVAAAIPPGFQFPDICRAAVQYRGVRYVAAPFEPTPWHLCAPIRVQNEVVGVVDVFYTESRPDKDSGPFLNEEKRLIKTIAERLAFFLLFRNLHAMREAESRLVDQDGGDWRGPVSLLQRADPHLYGRVARRMLYNLCYLGSVEAQELLASGDPYETQDSDVRGEINAPVARHSTDDAVFASDRPFELAESYMSRAEILARLQRWIQDERASFHLKTLEDIHAPVAEVMDALRRYHQVVAQGGEVSDATRSGIRVSLIRRFLAEQLDYIVAAKEVLETEDFETLGAHLVSPDGSHGKLGGKAAGLFLAHRILERVGAAADLGTIRVPKTWYVATDTAEVFMRHNDLESVMEQKYKPVEEIRHEYPHVVRVFKSSAFPPEVVRGLSVALDDLGDTPLIVRSSSLLEDRSGTAFSGKYKSLFLANQGSKQERLEALLDAIAEIYASTFGPDPIEYRRERGLIDFHEEMGILIQEVVGRRVGRYFFPAFAGVAFSRNEFRWSPRIQREDGLVRLVPGLGTRAVDRTSDDYPALCAPGQPDLRVNSTPEEIVRYSPHRADVIDLESGTLCTVDIQELLEEVGAGYPGFQHVFSVLEDDVLKPASPLLSDPREQQLVASFEGLFRSKRFVAGIRTVLKMLEERLGTPVDIEFAHDGQDFYLLQCRPQAYARETRPSPIPQDLPRKSIVFTAQRYVSNGRVPDLTHLVYVVPEAYAELPDRTSMLSVGRAVGRLNQLLPKRQFALLGPGRWGSRGDIQLGVSVTYADICNTALLVEIARRRGNYVPDLSFGTHFFQDLVESGIRYLPLYPDDEGVIFNEAFLRGGDNVLPEILPELAPLADVVRVIDIPATTGGRVLRVLLNAELEQAMAHLTKPGGSVDDELIPEDADADPRSDEHWRWRLRMAERIATELDPERFGVVGLYLFGSTKNATAGPCSDIDLLVHFRGSPEQRTALLGWLEGWSLAIAEMNYLRTGYHSGPLLDVQIVTDEDIAKRTSFASKIGAVTDAARPLAIQSSERRA